VSDPGTAAWHRALKHTPSEGLSEDTAQTPGMHRMEAISGRLSGSRKIWMGTNRVAPGMRSADHHHGEAETGIYVVSGHPVFVFLEDDAERRIETGPGDFVYVPPYVPHREENPSPDEERPSWCWPAAPRRASSSTCRAFVPRCPSWTGWWPS
jgi:uncharacterized RmlC-like cupin family protein